MAGCPPQLPLTKKGRQTVPLVPPELRRPFKQQGCHLINPHKSMQEHRDTAVAKAGLSTTKHDTFVRIAPVSDSLPQYFCPHYPGKLMSLTGQRNIMALLQFCGCREDLEGFLHNLRSQFGATGFLPSLHGHCRC